MTTAPGPRVGTGVACRKKRETMALRESRPRKELVRWRARGLPFGWSMNDPAMPRRSISSSRGRHPRRLFLCAVGALVRSTAIVPAVPVSASRSPEAASTRSQSRSAPAIGGRHIGRRRGRSRGKPVMGAAPGGRGGRNRTTAIAGGLPGSSRSSSSRSADRGAAPGGRGRGGRGGGSRNTAIAGGLPGGCRRSPTRG